MRTYASLLGSRAIVFTVAGAWLLALSGVATSDEPDFSGTWVLNEDESRVSDEAMFVGLSPAGSPPTLHVTQPANGTLVIESEVRESQSRFYIPDGKSTTPVLLGEAGTVTMASRWEGTSLTAEGHREAASGPSLGIKEVIGLSSDGQHLEIQIEVTNGDQTNRSQLSFSRSDSPGPCESWPLPCKNR